MASTITNLIPDAYAALAVVAQEPVGCLNAVLRSSTADRAAIGQSVRIPFSPDLTAADFTPAMALPSANELTYTNQAFTMTKQRRVKFTWSGEDAYAVNAGPGIANLNQQNIAQAIRTLRNEMATSVTAAASVAGTRATGTAGTTPFASSINDANNIRKILADNGAPVGAGWNLVVDTSAGTNLRNLTILSQANTSGTTDTLRRGILLPISNGNILEDSTIPTVTKGTGASYQLSAALAVGDTTVAVDTGSGTILAGDVVTISNHKYVVATALSGGSFTIAAPGIREVVADNTAITINNNSVRNFACTPDAILLGTRLPEVGPQGADLAIMREVLTDPVSGISFELAVYPGDHMATYTISAVWGVKVINNRNLALLLG